MPTVSVADIKAHLSEFIARSTHGHERFIITRRNRPVAALVSLDDMAIIEQHEELQGLAALTGSWRGFDELSEAMGNISQLREKGGDSRHVSL